MKDFLIFGSMIATALGVAFGYGVTKNRVDTAHDRIDALDKRLSALLATVEVKLDRVIRLAERIDERTGRERGE